MTKENSINYTGILLEDINSKFDMLVELVMPLTLLPAAVAQLQEDIAEMKADIKILKKVAGDHSGKLHNHEFRISRLESV